MHGLRASSAHVAASMWMSSFASVARRILVDGCPKRPCRLIRYSYLASLTGSAPTPCVLNRRWLYILWTPRGRPGTGVGLTTSGMDSVRSGHWPSSNVSVSSCTYDSSSASASGYNASDSTAHASVPEGVLRWIDCRDEMPLEVRSATHSVPDGILIVSPCSSFIVSQILEPNCACSLVGFDRMSHLRSL